jgi:hypothetical protein
MPSLYDKLLQKTMAESQQTREPEKPVSPPEHELTSEKPNSTIDTPAKTTSMAPKTTQKKTEQPKRDTSTPRYHDTMIPINQDTTIPLNEEDIIERVRRSVKRIGKEAATHRCTLEERQALDDIEYQYKRLGIRTSGNEITRIAVNYIVEDYQKNGENSVLAEVLKKLNS